MPSIAGSQTQSPYLKAASETAGGDANDSGLDLPLEKESPSLEASNPLPSLPTSINTEEDETNISPVENAEDEVSHNLNHTATRPILTLSR